MTPSGNSSTAGTVSGTYKQWFNTGTLRAIYNLSFSTGVPPITIINYSGTITVTGGTARLRGATGNGSLCNSPDTGEHTTCTEHLRLRLPQEGKPGDSLARPLPGLALGTVCP